MSIRVKKINYSKDLAHLLTRPVSAFVSKIEILLFTQLRINY